VCVRAADVAEPGRAGIGIVHVRHQVGDLLDVFDALQALQQVDDGTGVVVAAGQAQSQGGHRGTSRWGMPGG
jgi:hypothetical protein